MTFPDIEVLIPHREPMLLVDEIVQLEQNEIVCQKLFRADEFFFQGHYPDNPLVPGVILCECAAQTAAILLARFHIDGGKNAGKVPVLTRMNKVRFKNTVHPGDQIEINVKLIESVSGAFFLESRIRMDRKLAVSLELACTLAPGNAPRSVRSDQMPHKPKPMSRREAGTGQRS